MSNSQPRGFRDRANDSLFTLVGEVPELVRNLVVAEVNSAKTWLAKVSKDAGIGVVWFVVSLFFLFWMVPALGFFIVVGLASWMPLWLSSLIMLAVLFVLAISFAVLGLLRMKRLSSGEDPVTAVKTNVKIVKDVTDEF